MSPLMATWPVVAADRAATSTGSKQTCELQSIISATLDLRCAARHYGPSQCTSRFVCLINGNSAECA
eukprot:7935-Heterococcus_DN1.PRE.3